MICIEYCAGIAGVLILLDDCIDVNRLTDVHMSRISGVKNMSFKDTVIDFAGNLAGFLIQLVQFILQKAIAFAHIVWEWFISLPIIEKLMLAAGIPAICAVILPAAKFDIFDSVYEVNNPLSHYMAMIGIIMFVSIVVRNFRYMVLIRCGVNAYYLAWALYYYMGKGLITKADQYTITPYYLLNFIVPVIYIVLSLLSWQRDR